MIVVAREDVLRGLKTCKRLAKQDILISPYTSDPELWSTQAKERRTTYTSLMEIVKDYGVDHAYEYALNKYADLPRLLSDSDPSLCGYTQALEMFFVILGVIPPRKSGKPRAVVAQQEGNVAVNAQV